MTAMANPENETRDIERLRTALKERVAMAIGAVDGVYPNYRRAARAALSVVIEAARDVAKGHRDTGDADAAEVMELFAEEMERANS